MTTLRSKVDVAKEELFKHRHNGGMCSCEEVLKRPDRDSWAEHVSIRVVMALEEYALLNPDLASESEDKFKTVRVGVVAVDRRSITSSNPKIGGNLNRNEVNYVNSDGTDSRAILEYDDFMVFVRDMSRF